MNLKNQLATGLIPREVTRQVSKIKRLKVKGYFFLREFLFRNQIETRKPFLKPFTLCIYSVSLA